MATHYCVSAEGAIKVIGYSDSSFRLPANEEELIAVKTDRIKAIKMFRARTKLCLRAAMLALGL